MNAVPVWLGYQYGGLAQCEGMLRDEGDALVLEYQSKEAFIGDILRSSIREVRIGREILSFVSFQKRWFGLTTQVIIQTTRMEPIANVPGMSGGRLVLWVAKANRSAAEKLVAEFDLGGPISAKPARIDTGLE